MKKHKIELSQSSINTINFLIQQRRDYISGSNSPYNDKSMMGALACKTAELSDIQMLLNELEGRDMFDDGAKK